MSSSLPEPELVMAIKGPVPTERWTLPRPALQTPWAAPVTRSLTLWMPWSLLFIGCSGCRSERCWCFFTRRVLHILRKGRGPGPQRGQLPRRSEPRSPGTQAMGRGSGWWLRRAHSWLSEGRCDGTCAVTGEWQELVLWCFLWS